MSHWYSDPGAAKALYALAITKGLCKIPTKEEADILKVVAINTMATPTAFPHELYCEVKDLQPAINSLVHSVSLCHDFLVSSLENVLKTDSFTRKLFDIYEETRHDNRQTCSVGIFRSDYMLDWNSDGSLGIKQIELNTISCALLTLGQRTKSFHEYVCSRYAGIDAPNLPENPALETAVDALATAWSQFNNKEAVILFVVQPDEVNIYGQYLIEFQLWERYSIKCVRRTMAEIHGEASLGPARQLILSEELTCAVVYFRAGYTPLDYPTDKEWAARLLIEKSTAACCPNVAYQLVGTKKMQQCLAAPGTLERFISDPKLVARIRSTFAGLYSLSKGQEGDEAIEMALKNPENFVMKPQREGGGNNYYGDDVRVKLKEIESSEEREAFILMDRVRPPSQFGLHFVAKSHVLELKRELMIPELGIYGVYVRRGEDVILSKEGGHSVKTKPVNTNEGGIGLGFSMTDSPLLMATEEFISQVKSTPQCA